MSARKRGRKLTTGRFDTREELVQKTQFLYYETSCSAAKVAANCKVSENTIHNILNAHKYLPLLNSRIGTIIDEEA